MIVVVDWGYICATICAQLMRAMVVGESGRRVQVAISFYKLRTGRVAAGIVSIVLLFCALSLCKVEIS
jgi:hypothetical protein